MHFIQSNVSRLLHWQKVAKWSWRIPLFPIRLWNISARVQDQQGRTNKSVEGCHNGFETTLSCSVPSLSNFLCSLQQEQSLQEANLAKWEAAATVYESKLIEMRDQRLQFQISDYANRDNLGYYSMKF